MKRIVLALIAVTALAGCTIFNEAYMLDQEYGDASNAAFESQIAHPDYRYANVVPEGMEGVNAEGTMDIYNKSFQEEPSKGIDPFVFGVASDDSD